VGSGRGGLDKTAVTSAGLLGVRQLGGQVPCVGRATRPILLDEPPPPFMAAERERRLPRDQSEHRAPDPSIGSPCYPSLAMFCTLVRGAPDRRVVGLREGLSLTVPGEAIWPARRRREG
jgi:hypothetical protein